MTELLTWPSLILLTRKCTELNQLMEMSLIQPSCYEDGDEAPLVFVITLIRDDADHFVRVRQPENLNGEEIEIAMDIVLDLIVVRKDNVVGEPGIVWPKSPGRVHGRMPLKQWVDVYKRRMLYSDEELVDYFRERYKSERERRDVKDKLVL